MDRRLRIGYLYHDTDLIEISVFAWNGRFAGSASVYLNHEDLAQAAQTINGFPSDSSDNREISLGNFDPEFAGGGVRLNFRITDLAGHVEVRIHMEPNYRIGAEQESVVLLASIEAAAVDDFVRQLQLFLPESGAEANLRFAI